MQFRQHAHKGRKNQNLMPSEQSAYLLNTRTFCVIILYIWTQCIDVFSLLLQSYVRKGNDAKNPAKFNFFLVTEKTRLKNLVKCSACVVSQNSALISRTTH